MAYSKQEKEKIWTVDSMKLSIGKNLSFSKTNGSVIAARKSNIKRNPNGYIYVLKIQGHELYKIGVSSNPRRRIMDIMSVLPFKINILSLEYFEDVYGLEQALHNDFKENKIKSEWFSLNNNEISEILDLIKEAKNVCST